MNFSRRVAKSQRKDIFRILKNKNFIIKIFFWSLLNILKINSCVSARDELFRLLNILLQIFHCCAVFGLSIRLKVSPGGAHLLNARYCWFSKSYTSEVFLNSFNFKQTRRERGDMEKIEYLVSRIKDYSSSHNWRRNSKVYIPVSWPSLQTRRSAELPTGSQLTSSICCWSDLSTLSGLRFFRSSWHTAQGQCWRSVFV